jgi:C4-dicarboxylate transporter DctQ subunit
MFFGVAYCFKIEGHIAINLFLESVSKKVAKFLIISTKIISFLFLSVIAYYGYEYVITLFEWGDTANDLDIGLWVPHLVIPISFGFAAYTILLQIVKTIATPAEDLHFVSETDELMQEQNIQSVVDEANRKSGGMM